MYCIGKFENNLPIGTWLFFDDGQLTKIATDFGVNIDNNKNSSHIKLRYKCHIVYLFHNKIKQQGLLFFDNVSELVDISCPVYMEDSKYRMITCVNRSNGVREYIYFNDSLTEEKVEVSYQYDNMDISLKNGDDSHSLYSLYEQHLESVFTDFIRVSTKDPYYDCLCRSLYFIWPGNSSYALKEDGFILHNHKDGPEIDLGIAIGEWRSYDSDGDINKTVYYELQQKKWTDPIEGEGWETSSKPRPM